MTIQPKRPAIDWEAVHREFRANQLSVSEIARRHGCTEAAIRKRAKAQGWQRDLGDRVRQETRAKLAREDAAPALSEAGAETGSGTSSRLGTSSSSSASREDEARTIDMASDRAVTVVRRHRAVIRRGLDLLDRLLDEVDAVTTNRGELIELIKEATADDKSPLRRAAMMRAVELPGRLSALKDASMAAKNLVPLDRQAHSLDDVKDEAVTLESLILAHLPISTVPTLIELPKSQRDECDPAFAGHSLAHNQKEFTP